MQETFKTSTDNLLLTRKQLVVNFRNLHISSVSLNPSDFPDVTRGIRRERNISFSRLE